MRIKSQKSELDLKTYLEGNRSIVEKNILKFLGPADDYPPTLYRSMHYSLFAGGKRIRPILSIAAAEAVGGKVEAVIPVAVAIEMIHTYSLIHDDLPAMDDDDIRRGKPTNHRVFGEATAILTGDALLTHAFTILSGDTLSGLLPKKRVLQIIHEIGLGAGPYGMVGGQQLDMESEGKKGDIKLLEEIHMKKTAALIRAAVRSGGIAGGATETQLIALTDYAEKIGLAFQIADDILDVEGSPEEIGKSMGKDITQQKNTYPSLIGMEESKSLEERLVDGAIEALRGFDERANPLRMIAEYIVQRRN